jgi:YD repeat-containing protein
MTYDVLSRKTGMLDPDMGQWYYYYDSAGNLIAQVDARQQAINFYYDNFNRLRGKTYATTSTPSTYTRPADPGYNGYSVKYYYDEAGYGYSKGYRTRMVMSDSSSSASWTYDGRGRVVTETKTINGGGTFKTEWGYDSTASREPVPTCKARPTTWRGG